MSTLATVMGVLYVGVGVASMVIARHGMSNREKPGSTGFIVSTLAIATWGTASGVNAFAPGFVVSLVAYNTVLLGAGVVAVGWVLLAVEVTDRRPVTRNLLGGLLGGVAVWQVIIWTNPWHHLVLGPGTRVVEGTFTPVYAPGLWVYLALVYLLVVGGTLVLVLEAYRTRGARRQQAAALAVGVVPPLVASAVSIVDFLGNPYDLTPFGYLLTELIFLWALYRAQFLDIVPVARQTALEEMCDAVVTLDTNDMVVDYNSAAAALFDIDADAIGVPVMDLLAPYEETAAEFADTATAQTDIAITDGGETRHFDLTISPVGTDSPTVDGRVLVLRDVTPIKRREEKLDLMRQVQSRILRHNLRNELQTVKLNNQLLAEQLEGDQHTLAQRTVETADDLVTLSSKARAVEQFIDQEQSPTRLDVSLTLDHLVDTLGTQFPEVSFTLDCPETCHVETIPALELAFENLLENAAEHNDGPTQTVEVTLRDDPDATVVTVRDDGPGLPAQELDVLEQGTETQLEHGSGLGLWVVQWVVDNAAASIQYDTGPTGTAVTVRLPN